MISTTITTDGGISTASDEKKLILRDLEQVFEQTHSSSELFFVLTEFLKERYSINKSIFVIKESESTLLAISTWNNGQRNEGLSLNLPHTQSLFEKVMEHGRIYTEFYSDSFSGNFFERKLLLDDDSKSFALHPLNCDGRIIGLIGFSSDNPSAFAMLEEGDSVEVLNRFAELISKPNGQM